MHSSDSIFTGVKIIDYRNGRYQGFFNSETSRRHGMGILIDDDLNVYCSEWDDGRMNGLTFIYMSNGSYIYGLWKNNEPHGINIFRNRQFILIGAYHRGANAGNTLAITDNINQMLVFNGWEIASKDKRKELELISSESILQISLFEDIIYHTTAKNQIKLNKNEVTLVNFLDYYSQRHSQYLQFFNKNGVYYFGFKVGLGFKFTLSGKVNHRTVMVSIGSHQDERVTDFGVKFHQLRCIQQGNFTLKQTITYNRNAERPRDKCLHIFQKNHKKALNFMNQYFDYKSNLFLNIEHFLSQRLYPKYQQDLKAQFERKRLSGQRQKQQRAQCSQQVMKVQRQDGRRLTPTKYDKAGSTPIIENNPSSKDLMRNRSFSNLNKKGSKPSFSPIKMERNKVDYHHRMHQQSQEYEQYKEIQDQLNQHWKKEVQCQRCRSKQKKATPSKDKNASKKKSLEKKSINSKSTKKLQKQKSQKEIKYLLNYRPPQRLENNAEPLMNRQKSHSRSVSNISKTPKKQDDRQKMRIENEMKIRQQLYDKQRIRDIRTTEQIRYPLTFTQFLGINHSIPFESAALQTFSPSAQLRALNTYGRQPYGRQPYGRQSYGRQSIHEYQLSNERKGRDMFMGGEVPLNGADSIKNREEINSRRDRILRQFKALNTAVVPEDSKPDRHPPYHAYQPPLPARQAPLSYLKPHMDEKERISEFNKKYRNYLMPKDSEKANIQNQILGRQHYEPVSNEPYVASFTFSPARQDKLVGTPVPSLPSEKQKSRKRYQYFFDK